MPYAEVELVPWIHSFHSLAHEELIDYVQKLPRGSEILVEGTQHTYHELQNLSRLVAADEKFFPQKMEILRNVFTPEKADRIWAGLELFNACRKRGLRIIPMDSRIVEIVENPKKPLSKPLTGERKSDIKENIYPEQVKSALSNFRGKKLTVICGGYHCVDMNERLKKVGINSRLNTEIFSSETGMNELLALGTRSRNAKTFLEKNFADLLFITKSGVQRKVDPAEAKKKIFEEFIKKEGALRKRVSLKRVRKNSAKKRMSPNASIRQTIKRK
ncbi:MAG: hypothetical protein WC308_02850 [archaeon]|jgi:hypothetical protein